MRKWYSDLVYEWEWEHMSNRERVNEMISLWAMYASEKRKFTVIASVSLLVFQSVLWVRVEEYERVNKVFDKPISYVCLREKEN